MVDLGNKGERIRQVALLGSIPMVLLAGPLIGFLLGNFLDQRMHTVPWLMIFFVILGGVASVRQTMKLIAIANEPEKKKGK